MIDKKDKKTIVDNLVKYIDRRNYDRFNFLSPIFFYLIPTIILALVSLRKMTNYSSGFHFIILIPFIMLYVARVYAFHSNLYEIKKLKKDKSFTKVLDAINLAPYSYGAEYEFTNEYKELLSDCSYNIDEYTDKLYEYFCYNLYSNFLNLGQIVALFLQLGTSVLLFLGLDFIGFVSGFVILANICLYILSILYFRKESILAAKWGDAVDILSGYSDIDEEGNVKVDMLAQITDRVTTILKRIAISMCKFEDGKKNKKIEKILNNLLSVFENFKEKNSNGKSYYNLNMAITEDIIAMLETIDKTLTTCVKNNNTIKDTTIEAISKEVDEFVENTKLNIGKIYSKNINDLAKEIEAEIAVSEGSL